MDTKAQIYVQIHQSVKNIIKKNWMLKSHVTKTVGVRLHRHLRQDT